jgi:hypothetical protein
MKLASITALVLSIAIGGVTAVNGMGLISATTDMGVSTQVEGIRRNAHIQSVMDNSVITNTHLRCATVDWVLPGHPEVGPATDAACGISGGTEAVRVTADGAQVFAPVWLAASQTAVVRIGDSCQALSVEPLSSGKTHIAARECGDSELAATAAHAIDITAEDLESLAGDS